ncbi:MAG: leucine-rich repeat domain-containing protein, partial [Flavobacteriales bacterium]|nr:leucine-rich repeat domain-containing protein [Flavobacteriales bacterium]
MSHNNLNEIPENIKTNRNLSNLRLSYNDINTSKSIGRLAEVEKLKYLWLDHNNIEKLPPEIGELTQMAELYLGNNAIKELPDEIEKCNNLCVLYLG